MNTESICLLTDDTRENGRVVIFKKQRLIKEYNNRIPQFMELMPKMFLKTLNLHSKEILYDSEGPLCRINYFDICTTVARPESVH